MTSELNKSHEPLEELAKAVNVVDDVLQGVSFKDPKSAEYFYGDFLGGVSKAALKTYHFKEREVILRNRVDGGVGQIAGQESDPALLQKHPHR